MTQRLNVSSSAVTSYPFHATRTQVWRKVTSNNKDPHPSTVVKLPETVDAAKCGMASVSNQQALAARYLRNSMAISYAGCGIAVYHLGGLPGAGKTTILKNLIADLKDSKLIDIDTDDILLCSKSNSAKASLMSACETNVRGTLLYPARSFATLNSGFCIPVVHNKNEVTHVRVTNSVTWLMRKVIDGGTGNLQFLVIDEYTMSSCREIVYIDAILRMLKFRADLPFGGVFVLFLGDNRQNSAVVEDTANGVSLNATTPKQDLREERKRQNESNAEEETEFRKGGVENDFNNDNAKLYTDLFIKILKNFASMDCFGNVKVMKRIINNRLEALLKKKQCVSSTNDDIILANERNDSHLKPSGENDEKKNEPAANEGFDDSDDDCFFDETLLKNLNGDSSADFEELINQSTINNTSKTLFSSRCKEISKANFALKSLVFANANTKLEPGTMGILKGAPLSAVVEEGLNCEIEHLSQLKSMNGTDLENYARNLFNEIIKTATKAMGEIDYSGREKLYIVSSLSERFPDAHVTSLMDEEIINAKLLYGSDEKCCDALSFESIPKRSMAITACIKNAFIREGLDIKDQIPLVKYFRMNLRELGEFLSGDSLCYRKMIEKSQYIKTQLEERKKSVENKIESRQRCRLYTDNNDEQFIDDDDDDDDDVCHMVEDPYLYEADCDSVVSRPDVPQEICIDSSTNERVGALVDFHVTWYKWLSDKESRPSDIVRSRIWHLYFLVRKQQVGKLPFFDNVVASGKLFFSPMEWNNTHGEKQHDYHDEYWLRVLSMPVPVGGDTQHSLLLPAYSSFLSAISRTYIMSSLKRIEAVEHALALMYGLSLFDMTVNVKELVDSRQVPCLNLPIGYTREFNVEEYFQSIFPSIVDEYLMHRAEDVISDALSMEKVSGSLKVSYACKLSKTLNLQASGKHNENGLRYTKKSLILATRMLTSISKGNVRFKLTKEREEGEATASKRQKMDASLATSENSAVDRMMGAIMLTRRHVQKNVVSNLVDCSIIKQSDVIDGNDEKTNGEINTIKAVRSDTKFVIRNMDVSYMDAENPISFIDMRKILDAIRQAAGKPFIDSITDAKLLRESQNHRMFTRILTDLKKKVTRVKSVNLYQGQNVVFTNTNVEQIHGTSERFVTKDAGVVTDITIKNGAMRVSVLVERLGKNPIHLTEGRHFLGVEGDKYGGPRNAYVQYIPLESSQAMTIYSSQGQTFYRDTVVDLTNASKEDAYVAITRNSNPLNLYVIQTHETERKKLSNIKFSMRQDRASLLPLGGVEKLGGEHFVNYDVINVSKEVLRAIASSEDQSLYSALDPTKDTVTAIQHFILSRSGNILGFNSLWMANTAKKLKSDGHLETELCRINEFFFGKGDAATEYANYYADMAHNKMMELFTVVTRSVTHYCMAGNHIKTPSMKVMQDHIKNRKNKKDYVKIHPSFLNAPPLKESLSDLFFDVAPHTKAATVMQFYAHFLFLVYEKLHFGNASFAFLPSASPVLNYHTRPNFSDRSGGEKTSVKIPASCTAYIPGKGLGYESVDFANSVDGGSRDERLRTAITQADIVGDNIDSLKALSPLDNYDEEKIASCTEYITKCMRHNLRRTGKFCRPKEVCGLSKHGAIVVATHSEKKEHSHIHHSDGGWISMSNEANLLMLVTFMTKLAAASGVSVFKIKDEHQLEPKFGVSGKVFAPLEKCGVSHQYRLRLSNEILWCGQVCPMERVQFSLHVLSISDSRLKARNHDVPQTEGGSNIFSPAFGSGILRGKKLKSGTVLMMTEMMGGAFAQHSTSHIRSSLFHGVGKVVVKRELKGDDTEDVLKQLEEIISEHLQQPSPYARASFFITCSYSVE